MTPEGAAALVRRWVRFYTRDLPTQIADRRVAEIDADLDDHIACERAAGTSDRRITCAIASRLLRGLAADMAWRRYHQEVTMKTKAAYRSAVRVALAVALILSLPLVAMQFTDEVVWSIADFVFAGALLAIIGVALEMAAKKTGNLGTAIGIASLGVAAGIFGKAGDAPGLVLLGILLVASACAVGIRARASQR